MIGSLDDNILQTVDNLSQRQQAALFFYVLEKFYEREHVRRLMEYVAGRLFNEQMATMPTDDQIADLKESVESELPGGGDVFDIFLEHRTTPMSWVEDFERDVSVAVSDFKERPDKTTYPYCDEKH